MPAVLIVEDFDLVRAMLSEALRPDYVCHATRTAEEGLKVLAREPVDVVITDLKLPGLSGVELLVELRATRPEIPVIVVTGGIVGVYERDLLELGAFGYLLKPYLAEEVAAMVAAAVEHRRGHQPPSDAGT